MLGVAAAEVDRADDARPDERDPGDVAGLAFPCAKQETGDDLAADAPVVTPGVRVEAFCGGVAAAEIDYLAAGERVPQPTLSFADEV